MTDYSLDFPAGFDDYAWEVQSKGWFSDVRLAAYGKQYRIAFYDPVRLSQEIQEEIHRGGVFFEPNLVVVQYTGEHGEGSGAINGVDESYLTRSRIVAGSRDLARKLLSQGEGA